eukprot:8511555-Pyramimonas_sp.AAC.1
MLPGLRLHSPAADGWRVAGRPGPHGEELEQSRRVHQHGPGEASGSDQEVVPACISPPDGREIDLRRRADAVPQQ